MNTHTVIVTCDVHMTWTGHNPVYRLYVGNELFTERTWIWNSEYLSERITVEAPYGLYPIKYELMPHPNAVIVIKNPTVLQGPARFRKNLGLEITNENQ